MQLNQNYNPMKFNTLFFAIILLLFIACFKNENKLSVLEKENTIQFQNSTQKIDQTNFENTVYNIVEFYNNKDQENLNKLIHPKIGLYIIYRIGTVDIWINIKKICLDNSCLDSLDIPYWYKEAMIVQKVGENYKLETTKDDIIIECDSISKKGLFYIDNEESKKLLTNTIKMYSKSISFDKSVESEKEIEKQKIEIKSIEHWENNTHRIVLSYNKEDNYFENTFIFYVTNIEGKWYLTTVDFVSTDCSV